MLGPAFTAQNAIPWLLIPSGCFVQEEGRFLCQIKFAAVNLAAGNSTGTAGFCVVNFTDTPRNVVVCRALRAR